MKRTARRFRPWDVDQACLLPPSVHELVPEGHLAHFVRDTVREQLDLSAIYDAYSDDERGRPPFNPTMMVALDGSKFRANASKHKAMSYGRMCKVEPELAAEVEKWFGHIKAARGFRQFPLRGEEKVGFECSIVSTAHNLNKLSVAGGLG